MGDQTIPMALAIVQATNDGDDLDPADLKLVELAVNGFLNEKGEAAFKKLYDSAQAGYIKPWFHGIEHLTRDHVGYVYWKGQVVEHFNPSWSGSAEAKKSAKEVARRCRRLDDRGVETNFTTVIWEWPQSDEG